MAGLLSALGRGNQQKDPMRESAALTTVYLLEQNQKFEQYMRQKVDELESRVAAQQARLSSRAEVEERELWAALESFEVPPDTTQTAGLAAVDEIVVETVPESEGEWVAWDDDPGVDEPVNAGLTAEPEEIPDYLALMSGAATESAAQVGIDSDSTPSLTDGSFEADRIERDEPNLVIPNDETVPVIELEAVEGSQPSQTGAKDHLDGLLSLPEAATELSADNIESEGWPGQPYEMFQVNRPAADAIEEIWPELALADEVELLGRQPGDDEVAGVPATKIAESDATSAQVADETEQTWQTALSDGQKEEWT